MGNLTEYDLESPSRADGLIPVGTYRVEIIDAIIVPNKSFTGEELKFTFRILSGPFADVYLYHQLRLKNSSVKAERYGRRELAAICAAVRVLRPKDTSELHSIPLMIDVEIEPENGGYPAKNKLTGWSKISGSSTEQSSDSDSDTDPMPWEV